MWHRMLAVSCLLATTLAFATPAPDDAIRDATTRLQAEIHSHRAEYQADNAKFYAMVDQLVVANFDTHAIGQLVLGRNWREANAQQRDRFVAAFKNSLVHSYADAMLRYADSTQANWKPLHLAPNADDATVNADLVRSGQQPIPIGFAVHREGEQWKVYDVIVEGISVGQTFRTQFNAEIKQNGLDALIARLESGGKPLKADSLPARSGG